LTLFPLYHAAPAASYLLYADLCGAGGVTITEVGDGAVPELAVHNPVSAPVLLVEGEILVGLKQNRVLTTSVLVPALASTLIPVACVEAGRWRHSYGAVRRDEYLLSPRVRAGKNRSVQRSMRAHAGPRADQGAVWSGVDERLVAHGIDSETRAYSELHRGRGRDIGELVAELRPRRGQRGVLAAVGGEVVCLDLFDRSTTLRRLWPSLVGSYAGDALVDSIEGLRPLTRAGVLAWLDDLAAAEASVHPAPGLGETVALTGDRVAATALVEAGSVVHLTAFPAGERR
ncbi:MAG: ARPP-1 family domain-containing protein, partial [Candidatus Dormibacteria bacterium]